MTNNSANYLKFKIIRIRKYKKIIKRWRKNDFYYGVNMLPDQETLILMVPELVSPIMRMVFEEKNFTCVVYHY